MDRYFAYGSNLNLRDLAKWCELMGRPSALSDPGLPAYLPDHELVCDYFSPSRKGGVLDLRPSVGKLVPGALFEVSEGSLKTLDLKEGVPLIYRRVEKRVLIADGREFVAVAYEVAPEYRSPEPVAPSEGYVGIVAAGLADFGHDERMLHAAARNETAPFLATGLFVYGTLLREGSRHAELKRCGGVWSTVPATASGALLDCGAFPGMVAGEGGTVHGELVDLRDVPLAFTHLDGVEGFEGFEASRALFRRALITVTTEDGAKHLAWTYLWAGGAKHPRIASGDWLSRAAGKRGELRNEW
ncbi:MAG TPA: gamma-glutamylcyclotransferase [Candidatus Methanoperedens sp.]|nr:gamma-glutamylcyclotransferase [Candidatus Methanoperedens sp.]